ncbi:MAG TPA: hypothetical protein VMK12_01475, partial [Anaeromyxobacteraceae bacterium]|nr:hypothetical protein [Anaeromyxobacteraceae bacterium]
HVRAFERFKGAARRCTYDSQKPVVLRWEGNQPIFNPRFIDFATYYEFATVAACTGPCRSLIPGQADHRFRRMPISDSGGSRSPIPGQADR